MYARAVALVCLLSVSAWVARAETLHRPGDRVAVYLSHAPILSPEVSKSMLKEARALMRQLGYRLDWFDSGNQPGEIENGLLTVVDLAGVCNGIQPEDTEQQRPVARVLASTAVSDGEVLPFSSVDCTALHALMAPRLERVPKRRRNTLFGRAMGRVLAHELYHIAAKTREHSSEGVAKAAFSAADLLADKFEFQREESAQLHVAPQ